MRLEPITPEARLGFEMLGTCEINFADRALAANHWYLDLEA